MTSGRRALLSVAAAAGVACAPPVATAPAPTPVSVRRVIPGAAPTSPAATALLASSRQLVLVTTPAWDSTSGVLARYERAASGDAWRRVGVEVPVVVGRTGLAWDDAFAATPGAPRKHEGDGRSPAGIFPMDTVFGFAALADAGWVREPYLPLTAGTECVDDVASAYYNTVVDRGAVPRVDWTSAERMRAIDQYRIGVIVGYNAAPPRRGRGSCIFLHVWAGPGSTTAGCTAMPERDLRDLVLWMDRANRPILVQLPAAERARLRGSLPLP